MAELEVRYVTTSDGVRIAYAIAGSGPPMVTFSAHASPDHLRASYMACHPANRK